MRLSTGTSPSSPQSTDPDPCGFAGQCVPGALPRGWLLAQGPPRPGKPGVSESLRRGELLSSLSMSSDPYPRSTEPVQSSPPACSQGLYLLQALGGMKEEKTHGAKTPGLVILQHPPARRGFWSHLRVCRAWSISLTLFPNGHRGTRKPHREVKLESALFAPISSLTLSLWTGLTQLFGRMGPAASLRRLHLAWPCSPLSRLRRAAITAIPRRVLAVTATPRRGPGGSSVWLLPSACCS